MTVRAIIDRMVQGAAALDTNNVYSSGSIQEDSIPPRPFAVVRMGAITPGIKVVRRQIITIWVHDDPGDYTRVDAILQDLYGRMDGAVHVSDTDGSEMISSSWSETSDDLYDPGFRTITKNSTYLIIGKGA